MSISSMYLFVLLPAFLISSVCSETLKLDVKKNLKYGDKSEITAAFTMELSPEGDKVNTSYVVTGPMDAPVEVTATTIYFANAERNLIEIIIESGKLSINSYEHPYSDQTSVSQEEIANLSPMEGNMVLDTSLLPKNTVYVSASLKLKNDTIINYYGIKNYDIALPDTYVVENYQKIPSLNMGNSS